MKKIILSLGLICSTFISRASNDSAGIAIGLRSGIGINNATFDPSGSGLGSRTSLLNLAGIFEKKISDLFSLQSELGLIDKGFSVNSGTTKVDYSFKYLGLNLLPKVSFGSDQLEGFVFAGPGLIYNLSAVASASGRSEDLEDVSKFDFNGIFGAGAAFKIASGRLFLDTRYNLGLLDVSNESPSQATVKLSQIGFNIGYLHNF